jgi:hypothetical protein
MKHKALRATAAASILALAAGSVLFNAPAQAAGALTSAKQARAKALAAAPGTVLSVKKGTRSGYPAWAVSITRSDGSIVVGYVDVKNGIAFDWTVASSPGAPVIDLDGKDAALAPADPPKPPSETSSLSPVTGLGPGVEAPCAVSSVTGLCTGLEVPPGVSPVTGLGPGATGPCAVSSVTGLCAGLEVPPGVSPVTGLGPAAGSGSVSPVTGLGPVTSAPVSRSPLTGL